MATVDKIFKIQGHEVKKIGDYSVFTLYQDFDETIIYIVDGNDGVIGSIGTIFEDGTKIDFREER